MISWILHALTSVINTMSLTTRLTSKQSHIGNADALLTFGGSDNHLNLTSVDAIGGPLPNPTKACFTIGSTLSFQTNRSTISSNGQNELPHQAYYGLLAQIGQELTGETSQELPGQSSHKFPKQFQNEPPWNTHYELSEHASCQHPGFYIHELPDLSSCDLPRVSISTQPTDDLIPLRFPKCGEVFTSKPKDRRNNLKRPQVTICDRNNRFKYSKPGCGRRFPQKDFLNSHFKTSHEPGRRKFKTAVNNPTVPN